MPLDNDETIQEEIVTLPEAEEVSIVERESHGAIYKHRFNNKVIFVYQGNRITVDAEVSELFLAFLNSRVAERKEANMLLEPLSEVFFDFLNYEYKRILKGYYDDELLTKKISDLYASSMTPEYEVPEDLLSCYKELVAKYYRPSIMVKKRLLRDSVVGRNTVIADKYLEDLSRREVDDGFCYDVVEHSFRKDLEQALRVYKSGDITAISVEHLIPAVEKYLSNTDKNKISEELFSKSIDFLFVVRTAIRRDKLNLRAASLQHILMIIDYTKERYKLKLILDEHDEILDKKHRVNKSICELSARIESCSNEQETKALNKDKDAAMSMLKVLNAKAKPITKQHGQISTRYAALDVKIREEVAGLRTIFAKIGAAEASRVYPGGKSILDIYVSEFRDCPGAISQNVINHLVYYGARLTNDIGQGDSLIDDLFDNSLLLSGERMQKIRDIAQKLRESMLTPMNCHNPNDGSSHSCGRAKTVHASNGGSEFTFGAHAFKEYSAPSGQEEKPVCDRAEIVHTDNGWGTFTIGYHAFKEYHATANQDEDNLGQNPSVFNSERAESDELELETKREESDLVKTATSRVVEYENSRDGGDTPVSDPISQIGPFPKKVSSSCQP